MQPRLDTSESKTNSILYPYVTGDIVTTLELLKSGTKPPAGDASKYKEIHPFLYQCANCYDAKSKKSCPSCSAITHFWSIIHFDERTNQLPFHFSSLTQADQAGLFELACYLEHMTIILNILSEPDFTPRRHTQIRTAAYWAASNGNDEIFSLACKTDEDAVYALWQLNKDGKKDLVKKYYGKLPPSAREKYDTMQFEIIKSCNGVKSAAYDTACKGEQADLTRIFSSLQRYENLITESYNEKNFVVMYLCKESFHSLHRESQQALNKMLLEKWDQHLGLFWICANQINLYSFFMQNFQNMKSEQDLQLFKKYISTYWSQLGLLIYAINQKLIGAQNADQFFEFLNKKDIDVFYALITCLQERYPNSQSLKRIVNPADAEPYLNEVYGDTTLKSIFASFNLLFLMKNREEKNYAPHLSTDIWKKIFKFILKTETNYELIPTICKTAYFATRNFNPSDERVLINKYDILSNELSLVTSELNASRKKIPEIENLQKLLYQAGIELRDKQNTCASRYHRISFLAWAISCVANIIWATVSANYRSSTYDFMYDIKPNDKTSCFDLSYNNDKAHRYANTWKCEKDSTFQICRDLCDSIGTYDNYVIAGSVLAAFTGVGFMIKWSIYNSERNCGPRNDVCGINLQTSDCCYPNKLELMKPRQLREATSQLLISENKDIKGIDHWEAHESLGRIKQIHEQKIPALETQQRINKNLMALYAKQINALREAKDSKGYVPFPSAEAKSPSEQSIALDTSVISEQDEKKHQTPSTVGIRAFVLGKLSFLNRAGFARLATTAVDESKDAKETKDDLVDVELGLRDEERAGVRGMCVIL